ncbi:hypothetical protein AQ505_00160 [Pedobacter sp. PACM 27299]|uniref:beta strand repeat-containing protein n=1 Tax=Pedobacter sp. PACM 27299 TaxID=1727164 RepID=UPI000706727F|nr:choice-of-anchor Q domain-containing protein [Pedobacter sp. PACM 27299]ALL04042.1 hypothetical protein AQ505_00160 [Pedobacter sp. PACM 27299]
MMRTSLFKAITFSTLFFSALQITAQTKIYVNVAATGSNTGADWNNAYTDLLNAITKAATGNEIWVAKGTYSPGTAAASTFTLKAGVKMYGGFAGTENLLTQRIANPESLFTVNESILTGSNVNNHVVSNIANVPKETILDGFTITGGRTVNSNSSNVANRGAGVYNTAGSAVFQNLWIKDNIASNYGAGFFNSGTPAYLNLLLENNSFYNAAFSFTFGAGMYNSGSAVFRNVSFVNNIGASSGGGLYNTVVATLEDNVFKNNTATINGGALASTGALTLDRVSFIQNTAGQQGGAIYSTGGISLRNSIFSRNRVTGLASTHLGGAVYGVTTAMNIFNCSFSNNSIAYVIADNNTYGGALNAAVASNVYNSIFWGNKRGNNVEDQVGGVRITMERSIVQNNYLYGLNNIIANPDFMNAELDDLRLKNGSIAIDAGDNSKQNGTSDAAGNARLAGPNIDLGALENPSGMSATLDILPAAIGVQQRGLPFNQLLSINGGSASNWEVTFGALPPGISLNPQTGQLSGIPTIAGNYLAVIKASKGSLTGSRQYNFTISAGAARLHVNASATGLNNGVDWANGYTRLQTALALAKDGDEIWVAKGKYSPFLHADSTFSMVSGVKMYGGFAGTETVLSQRLADESGRFTRNEAILTGNGINKHVVYNTIALSLNTLMDGFTVSEGNANSTSTSGHGAGIYNGASVGNAIFNNLVIKNNNANIFGGGMFNAAVGLKLTNVLFENNQVVNGTRYGGGLYNTGIGASLNQVVFKNNAAILGGGLYNNVTKVTLDNVSFEGNTATTIGGGLHNISEVTLTDVVFKNNSAKTNGGGLYSLLIATLDRVSFLENTAEQKGGGLYVLGTNVLRNVILSKNNVTGTTAGYNGGGMFVEGGTTTIQSSTFSQNTLASTAVEGTFVGAGLWAAPASVSIHNSIFWGNKRGNDVADQIGGAVLKDMANNLVQNNYGSGTNNLIANPDFENPEQHDLRLKNGSIALDAGNNLKVVTATDFAGNTRIVNGTVDLGALENPLGMTGSLTIMPAAINAQIRGAVFQQELTLTGGSGAVTWSLLVGDLPSGVSFDVKTGKLSGIPTIAGTYVFVVRALQGNKIGTRQYTIVVNAGLTRLHVNAAATGDDNGIDWGNGFTDLQAALAIAKDGDEIWMAKGKYSPGAGPKATFSLVSGVKLYGGFAGTETDLTQRVPDASGRFTTNETVLHGNDINRHVVFNNTLLSPNTLMDGLTITAGFADSTRLDGYGAGIYNGAAVMNGTYNNLVIKNNRAHIYGGGMYNASPGLKMTNVLFENNEVTNTTRYGGGLFNTGSNAILNQVTFKNNKAIIGGGVYNNVANVKLNDVRFEGNTASTTGGGLHSIAEIIIDRASFLENTADQKGAGIFAYGLITIRNAVFSKNRITGILAASNGAGVYVESSTTATIQNSTFSNNTVAVTSLPGTFLGAGLWAAPTTVNVYNSIFWGNKRGGNVEDQIGGAVLKNMANNIVQNNYSSGTNNLIGNPDFENPEQHDLRLKNGSIAIDAGNNQEVVGTTDLAGNTRIINGIVDLGALENLLGTPGSLTILPATLTPMTRGAVLEQQFSLSNSPGAVAWSLFTGALPLGLTLNTQTGVISGIPMIAGNYIFVLRAVQGTKVGTRQYNIIVNPGATRLHVNLTATGINNGVDWKNGFVKLQSALTLAKDGDEIWVAKGKYLPVAELDSSFYMVSGVKMYGGFAGTETSTTGRVTDANGKFTLHETELSGNDFNRRVVNNTTFLGVETLLDGFTISGGYTNASGAGINHLAAAANGTFRNLIIKKNKGAQYGAGFYNLAPGTKIDNVLLKITSCSQVIVMVPGSIIQGQI